MERRETEVVIAGSGTGGATLALELSRRGRRVLVLEQGRPAAKVGTFVRALGCYDNRLTIPKRSKEGVTLWRTLMVGGSSRVSCGNAARSLEAELAGLGVTIGRELAEVEAQLGVASWPQDRLSAGGEALREAAGVLGYRLVPMPKFIDRKRCIRCGLCVMGCARGARWTAADSLAAAQRLGAEVVCGQAVQRVLFRKGRAAGLRAWGARGPLEVEARVVVLAAGGLGTPVILQRSGIRHAGEGLFIDVQVHTYGVTADLNQMREPLMAQVDLEFHEKEGFLLSPFVCHSRPVRFIEAGLSGFALPTGRLLGIMTKIRDEGAGCVHEDGSVSKPLTDADRRKIQAGTAHARRILMKAGADPRSMLDTRPAGSHPGGTAAIGRVVDAGLQTEREGLYVCDASVLPVAPGLPPIVTIMALAKRLAGALAGRVG